MEIITIVCVALLAGIFPAGLVQSSNSTLRRKPKRRNEHYFMHLSILYETNDDGNYWLTLKNIDVAVKRATTSLKLAHNNFRDVKIKIAEIRSFQQREKPLADYDAKELSKLLKNDTWFKGISKKTDNTQIIAIGKRGKGRPVGATTFGDTCSRTSRGVVIERGRYAFHLGKILIYNLACAGGIYDKRQCQQGFVEEDLKCNGTERKQGKENPSFEQYRRKLCFMSKIGWPWGGNWLKNKNTCEKNRAIRREERKVTRDMSVKKSGAGAQGDDSGKNEKVTYVILGCLSGALLITAALAAVWYWKVNKNDTERLTKKRFSVKYKYGPMKGQHGHSSSSAAP